MQKTREQKTENDWEQRFAELQRFKAHCGHCRVPLSYPEYRSLAKWALGQREKQGRLQDRYLPTGAQDQPKWFERPLAESLQNMSPAFMRKS